MNNMLDRVFRVGIFLEKYQYRNTAGSNNRISQYPARLKPTIRHKVEPKAHINAVILVVAMLINVSSTFDYQY